MNTSGINSAKPGGGKLHWENVYSVRKPEEVSWFQAVPEVSLRLIREAALDKDTPIIDVGGGDSLLVDHLLDLGYTNVTVLDISEKALERAMTRLGRRAAMVKWIASDATMFTPPEKYALWHDRATFHFFTSGDRAAQYIAKAESALRSGGKLIIGVFSETGPEQCSGLDTRRYSENELGEAFRKAFTKTGCLAVQHITPANKSQDFLYCTFNKQ